MKDIFDVTVGTYSIEDSSSHRGIDWTDESLPPIISRLGFPGELLLKRNTTENKKLTFEGCQFDSINAKKLDGIQKIVFRDCTIGLLHIYQSNIILKLENTTVKELVAEQCELPKITVESSSVGSISLEKNSSLHEISVTDGSNISKIDGKDVAIGTVRIHSSTVEWIHINKSIGELILAEGAGLNRFSIDSIDKLRCFIEHFNRRRANIRTGTISEREIEMRHQKQIFLAASEQYQEEHKYQELDICLVKLRKVNNSLNRMRTRNPLRKLGYLIQELILGKMFGWGVSIHNSIITSVSVILVFAGLYFCCLRESVDGLRTCIWISLYESVCRFFTIGDGGTYAMISHLETIEQIVGIIIMTIFTGVLARKIIR